MLKILHVTASSGLRVLTFSEAIYVLQVTLFCEAHCKVDDDTGSATRVRANQAQQHFMHECKQLLLLNSIVGDMARLLRARPYAHHSRLIAVESAMSDC